MRIADATTMRVGGAPDRWIDAATRDEAIAAYRTLVASDEPHLLMGGGSNTVASDDPYGGAVLRVQTRGVEVVEVESDEVVVRVEAGESWDALVARAVTEGWTGIEAMSGIPGSVGAAPIQNIGAYGQELGEVLDAIEVLDAETLVPRRVAAAELGLGYRDSAMKRGELRGLVLSVDLRLSRHADGMGGPVAYAQLARALGVALGDRVGLADARDGVLALRAAKGMVLSDDPDSVSAGSFFTNPIVGARFASTLPADAPRFAVAPDPAVETVVAIGEQLPPTAHIAGRADDRVKLSAAWLIERAGVTRGFALPGSRAAISSKHTLAITNRGGATGEQVAELARFVQARVLGELGVQLAPEPVLVGLEL